MKILPFRSNRRTQEGSTILTAVIPMIILSVALAASLQLANSRSKMAFRSEAWNVALAMSEAGVEEAMAHLNYCQGVNLNRYGWNYSGTAYYKTSPFGDGSYSAQISTNESPIVTAQGFANSTLGAGQQGVRRAVLVTTKRVPPLFGLISRGKVTLQNNADADSYDSADSPAYSDNGVYNSGKIKDNTFIGTTSAFPADMQVKDNTQIRGGVGGGAANVVSVQGQGSVGDLAWVNSNPGSIQNGHKRDDVQATFDPVSLPFTSGPMPSQNAVNGVTYNWVLGSGDYKINGNLYVDSGKKMAVTGNARLYVTDTLYVTGNGFIEIKPGAHLDVYVGKQLYVNDQGKINHTGTPDRFNYYGLNSNAEVYLQGNAYVVGVIYAPQAKFDMSGTAQLCGAGRFNEIVMQGDSKFHFDEALSASREGMFQITSWIEK